MKFFAPTRLFNILAAAIILSSALISNTARAHDDFEASVSAKYPTAPDAELTPGRLCTTPTEKRYAENIDYCERDVSTDLKKFVIKEYDNRLGYTISSMNRADFKIDHFIPLSIGGANDPENLWPQHKSVYQHSDPVELKLSQLMVAGKLKQAEAIRLIKECKFNLPRCSDIEHSLNAIQTEY
ncbi:MAG: HNH endonuclease signature motif containing protein [Pseudobdellovibrio sp.]